LVTNNFVSLLCTNEDREMGVSMQTREVISLKRKHTYHLTDAAHTHTHTHKKETGIVKESVTTKKAPSTDMKTKWSKEAWFIEKMSHRQMLLISLQGV
jgi:hypothetical protein